MKGIQLENYQTTEIADFKRVEWIGTRSREHCFTDGIGIISPNFAKSLSEKLKLPDKTRCPSAFQIRCGGYKGNTKLCFFSINH